MFRARLSDPMVLVNPLKAAAELIKEEVVFEITEEGLKFRAMDPANVAMVIFKLNSTAFDEYNVDEPMNIGISMAQLVQVLKRAKKSYIMEIAVEGERLRISYLSRGERRFLLPLLNLEGPAKPEPKLEFAVTADLDPEIIKEAVEDARLVSDALVFEATENELKLIAQGDLGETSTVLRLGEGLDNLKVENPPQRAKYGIEYLRKIAKGAKAGSMATLEFKTDYPMKLSFKGIDSELIYILAPRIDVE